MPAARADGMTANKANVVAASKEQRMSTSIFLAGALCLLPEANVASESEPGSNRRADDLVGYLSAREIIKSFPRIVGYRISKHQSVGMPTSCNPVSGLIPARFGVPILFRTGRR